MTSAAFSLVIGLAWFAWPQLTVEPVADLGRTMTAAQYDASVEHAFARADLALLSSRGCTGECMECGIFNWYRKLIGLPIGWEGSYHNFPFPCADAPCPEPCIEMEDEDDLMDGEHLTRLWGAVRENRLADVLVVMEHMDRVVLNEARLALQVYGCGNAVVAHLPLTTSQIAALTEQGR